MLLWSVYQFETKESLKWMNIAIFCIDVCDPVVGTPNSDHNFDGWIKVGIFPFDPFQMQVTQVIVSSLTRCKDYFSSKCSIEYMVTRWNFELDNHQERSGWLVASSPTLLLLVIGHDQLVGKNIEILNEFAHTYHDKCLYLLCSSKSDWFE